MRWVNTAELVKSLNYSAEGFVMVTVEITQVANTAELAKSLSFNTEAL